MVYFLMAILVYHNKIIQNQVPEEYSQLKDRRWLSFSGGCHLGLLGRIYLHLPWSFGAWKEGFSSWGYLKIPSIFRSDVELGSKLCQVST